MLNATNNSHRSHKRNQLRQVANLSYGTTTMKEYPQVRKTCVDAVHEKLPTEGLYHEDI